MAWRKKKKGTKTCEKLERRFFLTKKKVNMMLKRHKDKKKKAKIFKIPKTPKPKPKRYGMKSFTERLLKLTHCWVSTSAQHNYQKHSSLFFYIQS